MTGPVNHVILGFDGSPAATAAIDAAAKLLPGSHASIAYIWMPPFADESLRRQLWNGSSNIDQYVAAIEREGAREAERIAGAGAALARAAGWQAEPVVDRGFGGDGVQFGQLAEKLDAGLVIVGSRGLGGTQAVLGSVSDMVVHYARHPVLVVPHPLLISVFDALARGPIVLGWDGSLGARTALTATRDIFGDREVMPVTVEDGLGHGGEPCDETVTVLHRAGMLPRSGRAIAAELCAYARAREAAVVAVGSRGRSAVAEILLGSVVMATLHHAHRPVLVVPRQQGTVEPAGPTTC
jgi:nucleotide-binding universal stress UspA family protein